MVRRHFAVTDIWPLAPAPAVVAVYLVDLAKAGADPIKTTRRFWMSAPGISRSKGFRQKPPLRQRAPHSGCLMVGRNAGSGTRIPINRLLAGDRPAGYCYRSQPNSHTAVAVAVALGRADWGMAIKTVARQCDLGFIPIQDEHYDFVVPRSRAHRPPVQRFCSLLQEPSLRAALIADGLGVTPTA